MTDSNWWARAKTPPQPQPIEIRKREHICTLRKDQHEATLETRIVDWVGQELIFSVNGHWRRMRVFKAHERSRLSTAVEDMQTWLLREGWQ